MFGLAPAEPGPPLGNWPDAPAALIVTEGLFLAWSPFGRLLFTIVGAAMLVALLFTGVCEALCAPTTICGAEVLFVPRVVALLGPAAADAKEIGPADEIVAECEPALVILLLFVLYDTGDALVIK